MCIKKRERIFLLRNLGVMIQIEDIRMSVEAVRNYLKLYGLEDKVEEFEKSSATVELAANAAGRH